MTRSLTARQRLALGTVEEVRGRRDALRAAVVPPERGTPSALLGGPATRHPRVRGAGRGARAHRRVRPRARARQVRALAAARADRMVLDDWRLATANGATAQRIYAGGTSLEVGSAAAARLTGARPAADDIGR